MEKYKIKDLLLIYENHDCRFGVLNKDKNKIKIITKNKIVPLQDSLDIYVNIDSPEEFYAYCAVRETYACPIVINGKQANEVAARNSERKKYENMEEFNQLFALLNVHKLHLSGSILSSIFGIDEDGDFENENRNKFVDVATIEKIEKAINVAQSRNEYNIKKDQQLAKQRAKNKADEKDYETTLTF